MTAPPNSPGGRSSKSSTSADAYRRHKERTARRQRRISLAGREIGALPPIQDPARREEATRSLAFYLKAYFPLTFDLPWSPDHLRVIARIELAATRGGQFAMAMPRGFGKTSTCEGAALWSVSTGRQDFVLLVGATRPAALEMMDSIRRELEGNELLLADWPEIVYPIRCLAGITNKQKGQLCHGRRTHVQWGKQQVVLPAIPGSLAFGAILRVAGITGRIRGEKFKRPDGRPARPGLVIVDDPQTDQSADSPAQCAKRERILSGTILYLGGHKRKIAAVCPCTVIRPGDVADNILDPEKHPEWHGERTKMVYRFPANLKLWDRYAAILRTCQREKRPTVEATELYREHRAAMDEGAKVAWPERFDDDEISGLQHAMNLKIRDEAAFFAECQNEPMVEDIGQEDQLKPDEIARKLSGYKRGQVPLKCNLLTAMIDVHDKLLYWVVSAWGQAFTGQVIDYGAYPDQRRSYFTLRDARMSMQTKKPGAGKEAAIFAGLEHLIEELMAREWQREDGQLLRIRLLLVDAAYLPDVVYQAVRVSPFAAMILPSRGLSITAANKPFSEYNKNPGDKIGHYWRLPSVRGKRLIPTVQIDTNYWKSRLRDRWRVPRGDKAKGSLELWGKKPAEHRLYADHLAAEYFTRTLARGRTVDEWKPRPGNPDNHWLDCTVGNLVAASLCGIRLASAEATRGRLRGRRANRVTYLSL